MIVLLAGKTVMPTDLVGKTGLLMTFTTEDKRIRIAFWMELARAAIGSAPTEARIRRYAVTHY